MRLIELKFSNIDSNQMKCFLLLACEVCNENSCGLYLIEKSDEKKLLIVKNCYIVPNGYEFGIKFSEDTIKIIPKSPSAKDTVSFWDHCLDVD